MRLSKVLERKRVKQLEMGPSKESEEKGMKVQEQKITTILMDRVIAYVHQVFL